MGKNGVRIDEDDVEFLVTEDDKLPQLKNISGGKILFNPQSSGRLGVGHFYQVKVCFCLFIGKLFHLCSEIHKIETIHK